MPNEINNLKQQVQELMDWKKKKEIQQISFPLDNNSFIVLNKYFLTLLSHIDFVRSDGTTSQNILVRQDNVLSAINIYNDLTRFTVNTSTDFITVTSGNFNNDDKILMLSTGTLPGGLSDTVSPYYVVNSTGSTFQVSTTSGGTPVNITSTGVGEQYLFYF